MGDISALDPFTFVKQSISLVDALGRYFPDTELVPAGTDRLRGQGCPSCGHMDCFTITPKELPEPGSYYCFSCSVQGSVIDLYMMHAGLDVDGSSLEAVIALAKDWGLTLPEYKVDMVQRILNAAADFYHQTLMDDTTTYPQLHGKTPLQYQKEVRGHSEEVLSRMKVGWTTGGKSLQMYLTSIGYDLEAIDKAGLLNKKKSDFFFKPYFIYPYMYRGNVTRIRMKDETKVDNFHMGKDTWRQNAEFYNYGALKSKATKFIIVEGENDVLSILDAKFDGGVIGSGGQWSKDHAALLKDLITSRPTPPEIITAFDADSAGDKYRDKITMLCQEIKHKQLRHLVLPTPGEDIDLWLRKGNTLDTALSEHTHDSIDLLAKDGILSIPGSTIVEKGGAYFRRKDGKDKEVYYEQLSDFVIRLSHTLLIKDTREREIKIIHQNGESGYINLTSAARTSQKMFETKVADAVDGTFWGSEKDLKDIWKFVLDTSADRKVHVKDYCGHVYEDNMDLWLFRNCAVERGGNVVLSTDEDKGIFWINGNTEGVQPASQRVNQSRSGPDRGLPYMRVQATEKDYEDITRMYLQKFTSGVGDNLLISLIINGWAMSVAYSHIIFQELGEFPILCLWGKYGRGKTTLTKWLLALYGQEDSGYTTISNLKSGVGIERKASYYSSLPLAIDEIRNDRVTKENFSKFRGWYNRSSRSMGAREDPTKVVEVEVRSTLILTGEDLPDDSALRSRLIAVKPPKNLGQDDKAFHWLNSAMECNGLTSIGLHWISQAMQADREELSKSRRRVANMLMNKGCPSRTANVWSVVYIMAAQLRNEYYPEYTGLEQNLLEFIVSDRKEQEESDTLMEFWEVMHIMLSAERSPITEEHIIVEDGVLFIWLAAVYGMVREKYIKENRELLSENALRQMIKECPYFIDEVRFQHNRTRKRGVRLDLANCPHEVKGFIEYIGSGKKLVEDDLTNKPSGQADEVQLET